MSSGNRNKFFSGGISNEIKDLLQSFEITGGLFLFYAPDVIYDLSILIKNPGFQIDFSVDKAVFQRLILLPIPIKAPPPFYPGASDL